MMLAMSVSRPNTADQLRGPRRPLAIADLVSCIRLFDGTLGLLRSGGNAAHRSTPARVAYAQPEISKQTSTLRRSESPPLHDVKRQERLAEKSDGGCSEREKRQRAA
jgi:hypothetical protein